MAFAAILFDFDGLMIESERIALRIWGEVTESLGVKMEQEIKSSLVPEPAMMFDLDPELEFDLSARSSDSPVPRSAPTPPPTTPPPSRDSRSSTAFEICPYCLKELNLPDTPRACPYCRKPFRSDTRADSDAEG